MDTKIKNPRFLIKALSVAKLKATSVARCKVTIFLPSANAEDLKLHFK